MKCLVTAGPTYEPLDEVRRLTNFSTGRLGSQFAEFLANHGHDVVLLKGALSTYPTPTGRTIKALSFATTSDLKEHLQSAADAAAGADAYDAVFHTAAVSDFRFGQISVRTEAGQLHPVRGGKISSRSGAIIAELLPTEKLIKYLRTWFSKAWIVGWKYEVDGHRGQVVQKAKEQMTETKIDATVANGPAYGAGFGLVTQKEEFWHVADSPALFKCLEELLVSRRG